MKPKSASVAQSEAVPTIEDRLTLLSFPRARRLHLAEGDSGTALCGKSGSDAWARGSLRSHTPFDRAICQRCERAARNLASQLNEAAEEVEGLGN